MKIYLAGPMSGLPNYNKAEFNKAAAFLRAKGNEVFNPAELDMPGYGVKEVERAAFAIEFEYICREAEAIALLPGWENSRGAFAEWALGVRCLRHEAIYLKKEDYA